MGPSVVDMMEMGKSGTCLLFFFFFQDGVRCPLCVFPFSVFPFSVVRVCVVFSVLCVDFQQETEKGRGTETGDICVSRVGLSILFVGCRLSVIGYRSRFL